MLGAPIEVEFDVRQVGLHSILRKDFLDSRYVAEYLSEMGVEDRGSGEGVTVRKTRGALAFGELQLVQEPLKEDRSHEIVYDPLVVVTLSVNHIGVSEASYRRGDLLLSTL